MFEEVRLKPQASTPSASALNRPSKLCGVVQLRLKVSQLKDEFEREAERAAEQVDTTGQSPPALCGHDFSRVQVHTDERASEMAEALDARAFTLGSDIYFGRGEYAPKTKSGQKLLAHELTHVMQQEAHGPSLQRLPSAAAEGAAQTGETNPRWQFQRNMEGRGLRMNPAFWQVTYHLRSDAGTMAITDGNGRTALENVNRHLERNPTWRVNVRVDRIEVALRPSNGVTASAAARDLVAPASAQHYAFECFTAAALIQFVGVWRGLQQTSAATADATFDRTHADFRVTHRDPQPLLHMGGADVSSNLTQLGSFSLRALLDDPSDRGLERGDWVYLSNRRFITSGAFQGENATYLGNKRFHGHGIGVFTIDEYVARLRRDHRVRLSRDEILNQVTVAPYYRAPSTPTSAPATTTP